MKYKHYIGSIDGVNIFSIISLIICFTFFVLLFLWVFTYKKKEITEISNIPLTEDENNISL